MSDAPKTLSPSWRKAAAFHGVGVLCLHYPQGERFTFMVTDPVKIRDLGFQAIEMLLSEDELRAQLVQAGFSDETIEAAIQVARAWATTMTREK